MLNLQWIYEILVMPVPDQARYDVSGTPAVFLDSGVRQNDFGYCD
jgi:hypothetical protein